MLHVILEPFVQYDSYDSCAYQSVYQGTLYLQIFIYDFYYSQYLTYIVENYSLQMLLYSLSLDLGPTYWQ
jgi:hypothetical protein